MLVSLAIFIIGFTMGGLNYVVTVLQARCRGMTLMRMPLSVWGIFMATILALLAFPALLVSAIMMALDIQLDVNQTILMIGITGISTAIPAAPAGIGTLQYAFYITAVLFEFSPSTAFVASVVVQIVLLGSATVVGAIAYSYAIATHLMQPDETVI